MKLQDWRLIEERRLQALEDAIADYKKRLTEQGKEPSTLEDQKVQWAADHDIIERVHQAVHQLRLGLRSDTMIAFLLAGIPMSELPRLDGKRSQDLLVNLRAIHRSLPHVDTTSAAARDSSALELVEAIGTYVNGQLKKVRSVGVEESEEEGRRWALELVALVGQYRDRPVADASDQRDFSHEIWQALNGDQRKGLQVPPAMTWGEVLYRFMRYLEDCRGQAEADTQRKHLFKYLFPEQEAYCLDCDRTFTIDSRHSGRFVCPRCRARERQRKHRQDRARAG